MAKRFTDTDKWKKQFIKGLSAELKLVWLYILDDCDVAGLWQVDWEVLQLRLGIKTTELEAKVALQNHIVSLDSGTKWFIPSFIEFQYGPELSKTNNIFKSIARILDRYNLYQYLTVEITETGTTVSSFRNRISKKLKDQIFIEADMTCQYCQERKSILELVIDHFIPLVKGGDNSDENLVCSCIRCNSHKTDIHPSDFLSRNFVFLNPTEKIISLNKKLKGGYNGAEAPKDKDKDKGKVNGQGTSQGQGQGGDDEKLQEYEQWTNDIISGNDQLFFDMFKNEGLPPGDHNQFWVLDHRDMLNRYPKMRPPTQQAFRQSCLKHIRENFKKPINGKGNSFNDSKSGIDEIIKGRNYSSRTG